MTKAQSPTSPRPMPAAVVARPARAVIDLRTRRRRSKYHNVKVTIDGITFDSKAEYRHYLRLLALKRAGKVIDIYVHPRYTLTGGIVYIADFRVHFADDHVEVQDVKGVRTQAYKIKRRLMLADHGIDVIEIDPRGKRLAARAEKGGRPHR